MDQRDSRRGFLQKSLVTSVGLTSLGASSLATTAQEPNAARTRTESPVLPLSQPAPNSEWRNKQAGMARCTNVLSRCPGGERLGRRLHWENVGASPNLTVTP